MTKKNTCHICMKGLDNDKVKDFAILLVNIGEQHIVNVI